MNLKINSVVTVLLATTSMATAGGMDRATTGTSTLFEVGSYAELSYASTTPSVGPNATPTLSVDGGMNVTQSFTTTQFSFKTDLNDKLSVAISSNNNPFGVDVDYDDFATGGGVYAGITSLRANLDSTAVTVMARYKITDRVSAIAALKYQTVSGTADVSVPLTAASLALGGSAVDGDVSLTRASDTNFIVGASYEIPEIALRVVGTYESEATFDPSVIAETSGANTGPGQIKTPEVLMLEFQSGVAANTLVFGSIRHAKWEDAQVKMSAAYGNAQLSDFDNSTTYTLGVGRKFSDSFSASLSASVDTGDGDDASLLAPTGGSTAISLGGKYTLNNGMAISGGVSHRVYNSATWYGNDSQLGGGDDVTFGDNSVTTLGMKLSVSF
ncbi:hypothetical protein OAD38_01020 [Ascidiaceihabitans sp.]|nr:hypothetical protein [Ascidiaceihabitans sp.]